jgi:hypothetical protein
LPHIWKTREIRVADGKPQAYQDPVEVRNRGTMVLQADDNEIPDFTKGTKGYIPLHASYEVCARRNRAATLFMDPREAREGGDMDWDELDKRGRRNNYVKSAAQEYPNGFIDDDEQEMIARSNVSCFVDEAIYASI